MTHETLHWEETLAATGHRVTRQRTQILDAVCSGGAAGHRTFADIYADVRKSDPSIDRSTVYRALRLFVDLEILVVADTSESEQRYEVRKPTPHHHLVCRQCGGEQEISDATLQAMYDEVRRQHQFQVETDHLMLHGTCAACLADETPTGIKSCR
jgi:Fur family ferric uptake transcriptional regulator